MMFNLKNRPALFTMVLLLTVLGACSDGQPPEVTASDDERAVAERPNIILLLADDQRADTLSVAGHPIVKTPNIDALAESGVRFSNAFTAEPICAPSRFAFLSGQYERTSGLGFNSPYQVNEKQWQQTYPALLRAANYHTGFIGKFGVEFYDLPAGRENLFDFWLAHDGWLPFFPKLLPDNPATTIYQNSKADIATEMMGEAIDTFLDTLPEDKSFSLSVSFSSPHNSVVSSMYPDGADPDCESRACEVMGHAANDNPVLTDHPVYGALYRDQAMNVSDDVGTDPYRFIPEGVIDHEKRKIWYEYNYHKDLEAEHLVRYYQHVTGIDAVVGRLVQRLEEEGLADNTVIIYSSDHGLLNGEYGTGGKGLLYDLVVKVPLIIFDPRPGIGKKGVVDKRLLMTTDVPATILALAGEQVPAIMQGRDVANSESRTEVFLESLTVAEGNPFIEAVRTQDRKYVRYIAASSCPYVENDLDFANKVPLFEQLFDLENDPGERNNLVDDPVYAKDLDSLRKLTANRSVELTRASRAFKEKMGMSARPTDREYCW
ncbi:MAG: sulfatase-like hydrolase/transferase [Pseudomonadota bacterium]